MHRQQRRKRIHQRIRQKLSGTPERPRLAVYRSHRHISSQAIDDTSSCTLAAASSFDADFKGKQGSNTDAAREVGVLMAKRLKEKKIQTIVFDRSGYKYHGRVKALADALRQEGITF